jgi:U3 small nucleolar RNA-associated protein 18
MSSSSSSCRKRNHKREKNSQEEQDLEEEIFGKDIIASSIEQKEDTINTDIVIDRNSNVIKSVWEDEDDNDIEIDLDDTDRLKKLKKVDENGNTVQSKVTGKEFTNLLQERFKTRELEWAKVSNIEKQTELSTLLQTTSGMLETNKNNHDLQPGKLNINRLVDANAAEPSKEAIKVVKFHSSGNLLMVGGMDKHLRFFRIDGEKNEKQLSVKFNDMAIQSASFIGNTAEVVLGGRKPFFYSYDTITGNVLKIPGLMGKSLKSHENMIVSPNGSKIAFAGAAGYIHILCGKLKTWIMDLKMNTAVRSLFFLDEMTLVTSGLDADVYTWDLRNNGRCIKRFAHDDGTCSSSLSGCSSSNSSSNDSSSHYLAVGTESGVVSIFNEKFSSINSSNQSKMLKAPTALKTIMSLTTKITCTSFHPSGQILAIASDQVFIILIILFLIVLILLFNLFLLEN